jgi:hypothetical protein
MKIEILQDCITGIYSWTLYDGPEGIDVFYGQANSLGEVFEQIIYYRTQNAMSYTEDTSLTGTDPLTES